jgi:hypothetical protein
VSSYFLAFLLIFGLGHPKQDPADPSKSAKLHSRLLCDGYGAPEDLVRIQVTYSPGAWAREFVVSRYQDEKCEVDVKVKCLHREKEGWRDMWSATNEAAQYILSGWYQEGPADPKMPWHQATIQQVSTLPEVYEFTDPKGGTARLEITR